MHEFNYPHFPTGNGYLTQKIQSDYIGEAVARLMLPENAYRMAPIISLSAPNDFSKPIQFWQLFSVLGQKRIVAIVTNFYQRVFDDEDWFRASFEKVGGINHHINTQAGMWLDVMGAGPAYHGGEFRINFHHTHNASALMNEKGAKRWVKLMVAALDDSSQHMGEDKRVRPSINTFLSHFFGKYAKDFNFRNCETFGDTNAPFVQKINFLNMTSDAIEAMSKNALKEALAGRGVDVSELHSKTELVNRALSL